MPVYDYRGLAIDLPENDSEYAGYFQAAAEHRLVVRKCGDCALLRAEPGPGCPWCASHRWEWHTVSGAGAIYSYQIVVHSVLAGFRDWTPFPIVLVELDEQRGQPTPDDGLRFTSNLLGRRPRTRERGERGHRQASPSRLRRPRQRPDHTPVPPLGRSAPGTPLEVRDVTPGPRLFC